MPLELNVKELRQHYASLSDTALLALDRSELTEIAQRCYDEELGNRKNIAEGVAGGEEDVPDWLRDAACAGSFDSFPGYDSTSDLEEARITLESAEIPCHVKVRQLDEDTGPQPHYLCELMVPGGLILVATSVLDKDWFNPRLEAEWKTHLEALSDEEFRALNLEDLTAGFKDRVERFERAYAEEQARRESR